MTLTTRKYIRSGFGGPKSWCNERTLKEAAFQPKMYTIRLEEGHFATPFHTIANPSTQYFLLRLLFEPSPYPPQEEWMRPQLCHNEWEMKEFVGREDPKTAMKMPSMREEESFRQIWEVFRSTRPSEERLLEARERYERLLAATGLE